MNAESELEAVGMAWGAAATGTRARDRLDRPGPVADAGVARRGRAGPRPARRAQHGPGPGRLLAGHPGRRPRRLPHAGARPHGRARGGRAHAARVPPRRPRGATRCCSSATTTSRTRTSRSTSQPIDFGPARRPTTGRSTAPRAAPARPGSSRRSATTKQRDDVRLRPRRALPAGARRRPQEMLAGDRAAGRRSGYCDDADVVVVAFGTAGEVRPLRGAADCAPRAAASATSGRSRCSRSRPKRVARAAAGARARRGLREQPGQMVDDVRLAVEGRGAGRVHRRAQPRRLRLRHRSRLDVDVLRTRVATRSTLEGGCAR